ncbi:hypothetical protein chiPu_0026807, partial [Chiloscyllium punctatum]|nr:hypothetical protein [Chiloscyllium punctatum]
AVGDEGAGQARSARERRIVGEGRGLDHSGTDTGTDERGQATPGAEIGVDVDEADPALNAAMIGIAQRARPGEREEVGAVEAHLRAILTGDVGAEPAVELIADADAVEHAAVKTVAILVEGRAGRQPVVGVDVQLGLGVGHADVAAQIPAAEILDRRGCIRHRGRRHDRHVGSERRRGQQRCRACGNQGLYATHWLRPFGPVRRHKAPRLKLTGGRCQQMFKRHLTLIFKRRPNEDAPYGESSANGLRHLRQEHREQADRRQECAELIDEGDRGVVGKLAKHRGAQPADAERDAEEHAGDHAEAMRHQFLREHDDRRRRRRDDQADHDRQHRAGEQPGIGQRQRERQRAEDREPDHVFAAEAIAERATDERAGSVRGKEDEQIELCRLRRDAEPVDQIEDVIARQARDIELFGEQQRDQHDKCGHHAPPVRMVRMPLDGGGLLAGNLRLVPDADA